MDADLHMEPSAVSPLFGAALVHAIRALVCAPMRMLPTASALAVASLIVALGSTARALPGEVLLEQKISDTVGGFPGALDDDDRFGNAVAPLGDLDGNGVPDLAVAAQLDDDGGTDRGAVWILFLASDGSVLSHRKISDLSGFGDGDRFGHSLAPIGDLDGDGIVDLAVGADRDDDGGADTGAVYLLFLHANGTLKSHSKISDTTLGGGVLEVGKNFGSAVAPLGDLDGDGVTELAVGTPRSDDGGSLRGRSGSSSCCPTAASTISRRSATRKAASRGPSATTTASAARSLRRGTSMRTASPTWRWGRSSTTTAARTGAPCGCCSSITAAR